MSTSCVHNLNVMLGLREQGGALGVCMQKGANAWLIKVSLLSFA
jgi:hypothetical protein